MRQFLESGFLLLALLNPFLVIIYLKDLIQKLERFAERCPTAVRCFEDDFEACIVHLYCPTAHRRAIRISNLLERLFGEERRRMKVIGTALSERPVLKLMYASLIRASDNWRGVTITEFERRQLEKLQEELARRHREQHAPAVKPARSRRPDRGEKRA